MMEAALPDKSNGTELRPFSFPIGLRLVAQVISYIFHPLFIPLYTTIFLLYWHPVVFASDFRKILPLLTIFVNCTFFPLITVFLLWRLKFIRSFYLNTSKERIIPYAAAMIFYFWCWYVFYNDRNIPLPLKQFMLGSFLSVIAAWLANIYFKVSMHAIAAGGMAFFVTMISISGEGSPGQYITAAFLILGMVCTARMIISDHRPFDIYSGIILGMLSQLIAIYF